MLGGSAARRIERQHLTLRKKTLVPVVKDRPLLEIGGQTGLVAVMHLHIECTGHPRNLAADPAHAENAEALARDLAPDQLGRRPALPLAGADQALAFAGAPRGREDQQHHGLGGRDRQHARRIAHGDAARRRSLDRNMVVTDAERSDHADGIGQGHDRRRIEPVGRAAQDRGRSLGQAHNIRATAR